MPLSRSLCQVIGEQVFPAPLQTNNVVADIFFQRPDYYEFSKNLLFKLPELGRIFGRQRSNSGIDTVLERRRNAVRAFAHGKLLSVSNRASIDSTFRDTKVCAWPKALVQFDMHLWDKSPSIILELLLSSTARKFCFSEILNHTGLARGTVSSSLGRLSQAKVVFRQPECFKSESEFRAPRVYYTVNPYLIDYLRLNPPST